MSNKSKRWSELDKRRKKMDKLQRDDHLQCSFCGKERKDVRKILAGPAIYICDNCVEICGEILEDESGIKSRRSTTLESELARVKVERDIWMSDCQALEAENAQLKSDNERLREERSVSSSNQLGHHSNKVRLEAENAQLKARVERIRAIVNGPNSMDLYTFEKLQKILKESR